MELAHFSLILAFMVAFAQAVVPGMGLAQGRMAVAALARPLAIGQFALIALSFGGLIYAFLGSDFSLKIVFENSHSAKPALYKFAGTWGNHEGSMLLWVLMLAFLGAMVAVFARRLPTAFLARVLGVQGAIGVCFLAFSLFTSNPFARLSPVPPDGRDLNPLLQDPGLAFHPPFLYFGYVGLSIAFSFAVAALLEGRVDTRWARWVRPWTLLAWASLTLGIAMGAWWAYYELGWGGFWFWDPVENASLMPWLAATALIHSAIVVEKRDTLKVWTILMAIVAFGTSLVGTFLVRSGLLTSVHAFANDPLRGQFLLLIFFVLTGAALFLFVLRARHLSPGGHYQWISRESALIGNNLILSVILFTVFLGTFWPKLADLVLSRPVSVGPPYFNMVTIPFTVVLVLLMAAGGLTPWKRGHTARLLGRLKPVILGTAALTMLTFWLTRGGPLLAVVGSFMAFWVLIGVGADVAGRISLGRTDFRSSMRRLIGLPRNFWGSALAHMGVGVVILGMTGTSLWVTQAASVMQPGDILPVAGYDLRYDGKTVGKIANYEAETATLTVLRDGKEITTLQPERRWYPVAEMMTTEAAIKPRWASDIYVAIGETRDGGQVVRAWHHPLVLFLWGGAIMMALGALVSLSDRRYRAAVTPRSRARVAPKSTGPAASLPAE
ncbi:MAG: heme lyase CcmF/NrfE family subunit [Pseudomonadota bacterium]